LDSNRDPEIKAIISYQIGKPSYIIFVSFGAFLPQRGIKSKVTILWEK